MTGDPVKKLEQAIARQNKFLNAMKELAKRIAKENEIEKVRQAEKRLEEVLTTGPTST